VLRLASPNKLRVLVAAAYLLLSSRLYSGASASGDEGHAILEQIRKRVTEQISRSANYTCVETLDRTYLRNPNPSPAVCAPGQFFDDKEFMHDRLRLNLAVSRGSEIFSWYGENKFTSDSLEKIVPGGPISSGGFVGFLRNIFVEPGVAFSYRGRSRDRGLEVVRFDYTVAKTVSAYRVRSGQSQSAIVPFRGSFDADASTFELVRLKMTADKIPMGLKICRAESEVSYQMADIFGVRTMIPESFELQVDDDTHVHTVSRGEYSRCREFRAESKLRFDNPTPMLDNSAPRTSDDWLPAGLTLSVQLATKLDSKTTFTGDGVEAILTAPVRNGAGVTLLSPNAVLKGVVSQLETIYGSPTHSSVRIMFQTVNTGTKIYRLRAVHELSEKERKLAASLYGGMLTQGARDEIAAGTIFVSAERLRLDSRFHGVWRTLPPTREPSAISASAQ